MGKLFAFVGDCRDRFGEFLDGVDKFISFRLLSISEEVRSLGLLVGREETAGVGVMTGSICSRCCSSLCLVRLRREWPLENETSWHALNSNKTRIIYSYLCFSRRLSGLLSLGEALSGEFTLKKSCRSAFRFEVELVSSPLVKFVVAKSKCLTDRGLFKYYE